MLLVLVLAATLYAQTAFAQTPESASPASASPSQTAAEQQTVPPAREESACPGCPPRRLGMAFLQVTFVNVLYEAANLARGQTTARITPQTWWTNMKRGWEWDLDDFTVNQIGHPYQGNNYFTTGRANGLDFWESSALTAFGSGTWEYFGETNQASLNDFINTTLGGIALGEMFHRAAWLVRDTQATGRSRLWKEIGAAAIDPLTGINRFRSGDASRVTEMPQSLIPTRLGSVTSIGAAWRRGSNTSEQHSTTGALAEVDLLYGDLETGHSDVPYEAFGVRLAFGGGGPISEARVRGRLFGEPLRGGSVQLTVMQGYQYSKNAAYQFGAQSFDVNLGVSRQLSSRTSLWATGWGGLTVLGAVDSVPPEGTTVPGEPPPDAGQGVSTGPRFYDYGPGTKFGGFLILRHDARNFFTLSYEAHHLHVLDGVRANHLLQRTRADLDLPLRGRLGVRVTSEFFDRRTYYQVTPAIPKARFYFPQFRLSLTWSSS